MGMGVQHYDINWCVDMHLGFLGVLGTGRVLP